MLELLPLQKIKIIIKIKQIRREGRGDREGVLFFGLSGRCTMVFPFSPFPLNNLPHFALQPKKKKKAKEESKIEKESRRELLPPSACSVREEKRDGRSTRHDRLSGAPLFLFKLRKRT